jgi:hypothetical protein
MNPRKISVGTGFASATTNGFGEGVSAIGENIGAGGELLPQSVPLAAVLELSSVPELWVKVPHYPH